jgi:hypothetical protein
MASRIYCERWDLQPVNTINQLMKYVDDKYRIVPSAVSNSLVEEL